jgi:transketolase
MEELSNLAKLIRYFILLCSTEAGSGHPSSSLSATDLMTVLFFGDFFKFDLKNPKNPGNDRLIFSKGHASPLFYSLYAAAGAISEKELLTLRKFGSPLEGHPTPAFQFTEASTGSLGQGLSIGLGMALNGKYIDKLPYRTYVLLGDSEMAEGSVWEAIQLGAHYKLDNLIAILDVNRLGQRGETMYGHDVEAYQKRVSSFGWETIIIDGHNLEEIKKAFEKSHAVKEKPVMIIAKTLKGKGISLIEDKDGWHGKALKKEEFEVALKELGEIDKDLKGALQKPGDEKIEKSEIKSQDKEMSYKLGEVVATRKAYGNALEKLFPKYPEIVVLDAEVSNSTYADIFKKSYPERFFEMYIAEQNMVGAALGLSKRGKIPFVSTFAAFFSRAFDQIRMSQYSEGNIKFVGSHAGVSIGEDGASQMGLEDIAIFRSLFNSAVLYPSDAVSAEKLIEKAVEYKGDVYIRTTRMETPVLYENTEEFNVGGSKVLHSSKEDQVTVIGAGVTLHETIKAYESLQKEKINIRVIDLYSVKPLDIETLSIAASETKAILVVEDHFEVGGMGEAVMNALSGMSIPVYSLAIRKMPRSGKPEELLEYEDISSKGIIAKIKDILK